MLDKEKAAKMFIVAWVKNWSMRTLLNAISEQHGEMSEERLAKVVKQFPFMPSNISWYISDKGKGKTAKVAMPAISKKLNDALWDAKDNETRLGFYKYVLSLNSGNVVHKRKYTSDEQIEHTKTIKEAKAEEVSYKLSRAAFKKASGHDWNTIK
jgi:hypothetical protein